MRRRLLPWFIAADAFLISFLLAFAYHVLINHDGSDLNLPLCGAQALRLGLPPYGPACPQVYNGLPAATYPLTTLVALIPFSFVPVALGSLLAWSSFNALLALGIYRSRQWWRALVFLTLPFAYDLRWLQFAPLMLSVYFLPALLPLTLVKPQLGLSVLLTHLNRRRVLACAALGLLTLLIRPTWPLEWWATARNYDGFIPLLRFPLGPLMLIAILKWRDPRALFLLLFATSPQRSFYDLLLLFAIPNSRREMVLLVALSWLLPFWTGLGIDWRDWSLLVLYFPALALILAPAYPMITMKLRVLTGVAGR